MMPEFKRKPILELIRLKEAERSRVIDALKWWDAMSVLLSMEWREAFFPDNNPGASIKLALTKNYETRVDEMSKLIKGNSSRYSEGRMVSKLWDIINWMNIKELEKKEAPEQICQLVKFFYLPVYIQAKERNIERDKPTLKKLVQKFVRLSWKNEAFETYIRKTYYLSSNFLLDEEDFWETSSLPEMKSFTYNGDEYILYLHSVPYFAYTCHKIGGGQENFYEISDGLLIEAMLNSEKELWRRDENPVKKSFKGRVMTHSETVKLWHDFART